MRDELSSYWAVGLRFAMQQIQFDVYVRANLDFPLNLSNSPVARNVIVSAHESFGETGGNAF